MSELVPPVQKQKGIIPAYRSIQDTQGLMHLEGRGNYTLLYFRSRANPLLVSKTLKYFEQELPSFLRLSKTAIVNPLYVRKVHKKGAKSMSVELLTDLILSVSRRRIKSVIARLDELIIDS